LGHVRFHKFVRGANLVRVFVASMLCWTAGCGLFDFGGSSSIVDGNRGATLSGIVGRSVGEPNDDFADALTVFFDDLGRARLAGVIEDAFDVDVFDLGPLRAGDRVVVDVATDRFFVKLDSMIAVFDANQSLIAENDDRPSDLDARIDHVIREDSESFYLVVAKSGLASRSARLGPYYVDITVGSGNDVPQPMSQVVLLDFDGGDPNAPILGVSVVPPFSASAIDRDFDGQDDVLKGLIADTFRLAFADFDVVVLTTDDVERPSEPFTTIFFGGFHPPGVEAFGISESVDSYNADPADVGIIFSETFRSSVFSTPPSIDQMGVAIGNIAAHEFGHLLGLNHVDDETAIMDAVSPADTFLDVQTFQRAPLFASELFPIGFQDAMLLLTQIVGAP
jgi:Matrixin